MAIASIDPRTGETRQTFERLTDAEVDRKLEAAHRAFQSWRRTSFATRSQPMLRAAEILEAEKQTLGRMMTEEMGKTLTSAMAEAEKCALGCRYYAQHAEAALADETIPTSAQRSYVRYLPMGVVLAVMPWNFPFWQVFRFIAPTLMAGNVGLLKHASNVPRCALAIEDVLRRAGFPEGVFQTLLIGAAEVPRVLDDPPGRRRDADRQRTGRRGRRVAVREAHQTACARARRQRSVHRHALGRFADGAERNTRRSSRTGGTPTARSPRSTTRAWP